jgi:hypothetical protein
MWEGERGRCQCLDLEIISWNVMLGFVISSGYHCPISYMPRSPAKPICPVEACRKECRTYAGLTQHLHAKHIEYQRGGTPPSASAVNDGIILDVLDSDSDSNLSYMSTGAFQVGSNHDSNFEFPLQVLPSSRTSPPNSPNLPSRESEVLSKPSDSTEYHPLINGQLPKCISAFIVYLHFYR